MKTERITILASAQFKRRLESEAAKAGVSVGELVRQRFETTVSPDEQLLARLAAELRTQTAQARAAMQTALQSAETTLQALRAQRPSNKARATA